VALAIEDMMQHPLFDDFSFVTEKWWIKN
jgi:hypothetical protein